MKLNLAVFIVSFLFVFCNSNRDVDINEVSKSYYQYLETNDFGFLLNADSLLHLNEEFIKKGLTDNNNRIVIPVLTELEKFEELDTLLLKDTSLKVYYRKLASNLVKAYLDSLNYRFFLDSNLAIIEDSLVNGGDSLLYVDYFLFEMHLYGKDQTQSMIDSMRLVEHEYSDIYYDFILKDKINDYPEEKVVFNYHNR